MGATVSSTSEAVLSTVRELYDTANGSVTWQDVFTYGAIFAGSWLFYRFFIEPFLSPIRKVPGGSYHPIWGNMPQFMKGEAMEGSLRMFEEHGLICRYYFFFGSERLLVGDPEIMKHIMVTNSKNYIKPPNRMKIVKMVLGDLGLVSINGAEHLAKRKMINPAFSYASIKKMLPLFESGTAQLRDKYVKEIEASGETWQECDIHNNMSLMTMDVIGQSAFGYKFKSLHNEHTEVANAFISILAKFDFSWRLLAIPYYQYFPVDEVRRFKCHMEVIEQTVTGMIDKRLKQLEEQGEDCEDLQNDLLGMLTTAKNEEGKPAFSPVDLRDQVMTFLFAGHETTSIGITWCLLALAQNEEIQEKLRAEVRENLPSGDEPIPWETIESLEYLNCVVKESLRLYPPVPLVLRQAVHEDQFGKYKVPAGTIILVAPGAMMRCSRVWSDPLKFDPERFREDKKLNPYQWLPFVQGPRMCIGYKFALAEMKIAVAKLVRDLKFKVIPGSEYKRVQRVTMRPEPALRLLVARV